MDIRSLELEEVITFAGAVPGQGPHIQLIWELIKASGTANVKISYIDASPNGKSSERILITFGAGTSAPSETMSSTKS